MEAIELGIEPRGGKGTARAVRLQGKVPAVLYGAGRGSTAVAVDAKEFEAKIGALEGTHLIRLTSAATELGGRLVLVKEVQRHPLSRRPIHADLYEVDVNARLTLRVALHFVGRAAGVENGGILQPIRREVEVRCLPTEIPDFIEVDVTNLAIHDVLHLRDLKAPAGAEIVIDTDEAVVSVLPPVVEEVKVAAAGTPGTEGAAVPSADAAKAEAGKVPASGKAPAGGKAAS